ncbi:MAG: NAD(P)-binding protein [Gammaproteobacteria bacterium]|jgi:phytoene dehydrogenase-like protein|nr:NAD(P)-binding protein [Gammaproteobacteria bacterium]
MTDVLIIGAGHNGLVCAAYLARAGMDVLVLESSDSAGGMSAPRTISDDYRFPGLAHATYPVCKAIRKDLRLDRYGYVAGTPIDTIALDASGQHLVIGGNTVSGGELPESDAGAFPSFKSQYLEFARKIQPLFLNKPPRLKNMGSADLKTLTRLGWNIRMGLGKEAMYEFLRVAAINIYDVLDEEFQDDRLKGAIAADAVMGSAMGPRTPGTVLTWLQRLQGELNGPLSSQGGAQLVHALTQSAEDAGATIRFDARVEKILIDRGKAFGVELADGEMVKAKLIISNVDPRTTLSKMVGAPRLDTMFANRVTQIRGSGVVGKLNIALNGLPVFDGLSESQLGNRLLVAPSMRYVEHAFNHSKYGKCSEHPVLEVTLPSLHDRSLAPEGHHVMSLNIAYLPHALEGGWEEQKATVAYKVISQLGEYSPNLKSLIVDHEFLTPLDIESEFGAVQGHWHHGELSIHQSFMMRPLYGAAQYDTPVDRLFLCGAGSHPGGGLNGLPGRNAAKRVLELGGVK